MEFLVVALGGAVGAMARYAISLIPVKSGFPFLTLATNIMGALLIGFVVGIASGKNEVSENTILFWKTGVCGGFTTFSTFSLAISKFLFAWSKVSLAFAKVCGACCNSVSFA